MKLERVYKVNLFAVYAEEKIKYYDKFLITYSNRQQEVKYATWDHGVLSVVFDRDENNNNREIFYFTFKDNPGEEILVFVIENNGRYERYSEDYFNVPKDFKEVIESYGEEAERDRMKIELSQAAAKKHLKLIEPIEPGDLIACDRRIIRGTIESEDLEPGLWWDGKGNVFSVFDSDEERNNTDQILLESE